MGRVVGILVAAAACLSSAACGSSEDGPEPARQLDPRSDAVVAVDLDYDGGNWQQIKRLYARAVQEGGLDAGRFTPPTLDGALGTLASAMGLSFDDDLRPLLGGTLQIGVRVEPAEPLTASARDVLERLDPDATRFGRNRARYFDYDGERLDTGTVEEAMRQRRERRSETSYTAVYTVQDADALERVLDKLRGQGLESRPLDGVEDAQRLAQGIAVVGRDTIVAALDGDDGGDDAQLRERLQPTGDGPAVPDLGDDFLALRLAPTVLGTQLDREQLDRALDSTAGRALRGAELRLALEEDAARASGRVDFEGLAEGELPLPGPGALALPAGEPLASASADQSATTVFLARLARELFPDSRFVRRVEQLEVREGLRFEDEVLRQFSGPSLSVLRLGPDGALGFGARSTLRDPAAMRALLERIAPDLPGILEGLQGLGAAGLTTLLLVAPDAPLTPGAFGLLAAVDVRRLAGDGSEQLYEVTGLDERDARPGPNRVVYGLVGDAFVVASSPELAREVAAIPTEQAQEAATRGRADLAGLLDGAAAWLGDDAARTLRALVESAEASASAEGGDIVAAGELRWAR